MIIVPITLNTRCARAAFLPTLLATVAAMLAVMVVPMLSPITRAIATSKPIYPLKHMASAMAIMAAEA